MSQAIHMLLAQQIVDTLKTVCEHDINFIDPEGVVRASTDPDRVGGYHVGGHEAAKTGRIVTIRQDDPFRNLRWGINMPIRFHGRTEAVIGITGPPEEVRRYADLAQRLTLLLLREHEVDSRAYDLRAQTGHLVRALTEHERVEPEFLLDILRKNGMTDDGGLWRTVLLRVKTVSGRPLMELESAIQGCMDRLGSSLYAFLYPGEFRLLLPEAGFTQRQSLLAALAEDYPEELRIAVGAPKRLLRQDRSAESAALLLRSLGPGQNYAVYERMGLELLLGSVGPAAAEVWRRSCLGRLEQADRSLLALYFANELSLQDTARALYLHKNTLQYRLNRIRTRSGLDPRRFRDACALYTALCLERISGTAPEPAEQTGEAANHEG